MRAALVGELLGSFLLVLFGTGAVASSVLTGALQELWQVAAVWGIGVTVAIYSAAPLPGHISIRLLAWPSPSGGPIDFLVGDSCPTGEPRWSAPCLRAWPYGASFLLPLPASKESTA